MSGLADMIVSQPVTEDLKSTKKLKTITKSATKRSAKMKAAKISDFNGSDSDDSNSDLQPQVIKRKHGSFMFNIVVTCRRNEADRNVNL